MDKLSLLPFLCYALNHWNLSAQPNITLWKWGHLPLPNRRQAVDEAALHGKSRAEKIRNKQPKTLYTHAKTVQVDRPIVLASDSSLNRISVIPLVPGTPGKQPAVNVEECEARENSRRALSQIEQFSNSTQGSSFSNVRKWQKRRWEIQETVVLNSSARVSRKIFLNNMRAARFNCSKPEKLLKIRKIKSVFFFFFWLIKKSIKRTVYADWNLFILCGCEIE